MPGAYQYLPLERVVFGKPAAQAAAEEAARIGARRVFVVSSKTLSRSTDEISRIRNSLGSAYAGLFDECIAHTPWPSVLEAAAAVRAAKPDLILTVGGGTPIDTVKILQILLAHEVADLAGMESLRTATKPSPVRQVVIPTTLSGAEFSNIGGGTDPRTKLKHSFSGADVGARSVILDPAITMHTPEWLWRSTGVRGVDHAVEALLSIEANAYCDGLAVHALKLFNENLAKNDLESRLACQQASWLAASTIGRVPYGASHGIGHALGAAANVPHGHTSCVMLPHVMRYNERVSEQKQRLVAEALGVSGRSGAAAVAQLIADLGQPSTLKAVGVKREQIGFIADAALKNRWVQTNPRPFSREEMVALLEAAYN